MWDSCAMGATACAARAPSCSKAVSSNGLFMARPPSAPARGCGSLLQFIVCSLWPGGRVGRFARSRLEVVPLLPRLPALTPGSRSLPCGVRQVRGLVHRVGRRLVAACCRLGPLALKLGALRPGQTLALGSALPLCAGDVWRFHHITEPAGLSVQRSNRRPCASGRRRKQASLLAGLAFARTAVGTVVRGIAWTMTG